jgi:hypothetical protein
MQLPLSLGGLSLRLPASLINIAYAAACGECIPHLTFMAKRLGFVHSNSLIAELDNAQSEVTFQIMGYEKRLPGSSPCFERSLDRLDPSPLQEGLTILFNHAEIVSIQDELKLFPLFALAFAARTDARQQHCSWVFNPKARANLNIAALADEDFSRAIQIAILRPITLPRQCDCGAIIDPVGLHFLHCKLVHFGYLHDCVKHAIATTIRSFQHRDLAPLSVLTEVKVNRFYRLRYPAPEGVELEADIVFSVEDISQQVCVIVDVSSVLARDFNANLNFHAPMRARSRDKCLKYDKYDIPVHLFHPVTVGRTNVLSADAAKFSEFMGKFFPLIPKAADKISAAISRAIVVGAARTFNTAVRRAQLASFNATHFSNVPKSAACSRFNSVFPLPSAMGTVAHPSVARIPPVDLPRLSGALFGECIVHDAPLDSAVVGQSWS